MPVTRSQSDDMVSDHDPPLEPPVPAAVSLDESDVTSTRLSLEEQVQSMVAISIEPVQKQVSGRGLLAAPGAFVKPPPIRWRPSSSLT